LEEVLVDSAFIVTITDDLVMPAVFHDDYDRDESNHRLFDPAAPASASLRASVANKFLTKL
jgi:hypothetical protein